MERAVPENASYRDPAGRVYLLGDRVLRSVTRVGAADYEFLRDGGLLDEFTDDGRVIGCTEVEPGLLGQASDVRYVLEHPRLSFISHPYEWCFSALKAAALLHLDLSLESLERGATLSDASAYNVQFQGARPIFIDVLSFRRYRDGEYWFAHRQFLEQFLNPLLLTALRGVPFNVWLRGRLEGIPSEDLRALLPWWRMFDWRVSAHVILPARFQRSAAKIGDDQVARIKARSLPKSAFRSMLASLRRWIEGLEPSLPRQSAWSDYAETNGYRALEAESKANFLRRFAAKVTPRCLWDVGCNTGHYAEVALEAGAKEVIGFDTDHGALEKAFARASKGGVRLLPLYLDAADPSPGQGWRGIERKALGDRRNADGLLALAVVHHLAIGRNLPLKDVVDWLIDLAPQGVIEFVEKDDPCVRQMLQFRNDIFPDYERENFRAAVLARAEIIEEQEITANRRLLVWYNRRDD